MCAKIFSDIFLINSDDIDVNWEFHYQISGNGRSRSARSDFAAIVFNNTDQQFFFFIVEFETDRFSVHKDEMFVMAEVAFKYNCIFTVAYYLLKDKTTIHLGSMKLIYNKEKKSLIYVYEKDNVTFKLYIGNQETNIASALKLVTYLRINRAAKSSPKSDTQFTFQTKRIMYIDVGLNNNKNNVH
ncbi:15915_t:CDS:2 [Cetraspora pellucida]|uniref:15915_t:CDS:1 n=1 Tax=Cetraspora pellucida TaxID=1433469 RepID=A0ACA9LWA3_9GLOM|nr:15915_t:CDS:2 [Cetraspora pellucida]